MIEIFLLTTSESLDFLPINMNSGPYRLSHNHIALDSDLVIAI